MAKISELYDVLPASRRSVYDYIYRYSLENNGLFPSLRMISFGMDMPISVVYFHVKSLMKSGLIVQLGDKYTHYKMVGAFWRMNWDYEVGDGNANEN